MTVRNAWWLLAMLGFGLAAFTHADPDLWGHLRFGLDLLETGRLTATDPYSFTQDRPWHNHEWLSEVVMAAAWKAGGVTGLVMLKAALVTAAGALVWGATRGATPLTRLVVLAWLMFGAVHMVSTLRPQLWSFVGIALLARHLLTPSRATYFILPAAFAVWANMHGGWFVGLAVLGAWTLGGGVVETGRRTRTIALGLACAAATLATPYGTGTWTFILTTVRFERTITEWRPLYEGASVAEWAAWLATTMALAYGFMRSRGQPLARVIALTVLAVAAIRIMRMGSLYVTVACVFAAPWLVLRWPERALNLKRKPLPRAAALLLAVPALAALVASARLTATAARCVPTGGPWQPDAAVLSVLRAAPPGRLVTTFDWGQFALWHVGPAIKVSIDGRRETIYSNAQLQRHEEVLAATAEGQAILNEWRPDYVWLPRTLDRLRPPLEASGYRLVLESGRSWLVSRVPLVVPSTDTFRGCFPD